MAAPDTRPIIAVTVGDPAGIGPEIVVKALSCTDAYTAVRPIVFSDSAVLSRALGTASRSAAINVIADPSEGRYEHGCLDLVDVGSLEKDITQGQISAEGGQAAFDYLDSAITFALDGRVDGLATAPINKESLRAAAVPFIDHTAMLKARAALHEPTTLFVTGSLRIFFLTRHISFRQIPDAITREEILTALPLCDLFLRQLEIEGPTIAVAALNPHGGETGLFGTEEMDVIRPAIEEAQSNGWRVAGPVPADSVFHQTAEGRYDAVLSLYHDQGHIAAKTLDFHGTVSLTMGLRFLRTSVDHGTAFDIAGTGIANERGMLEAVKAAGRYAGSVRDRLGLEPVE
jgi:4-phospho-D-threonate 3-dehydrogenase / 4-phospho-D-erythronate 3-dehydrogenase